MNRAFNYRASALQAVAKRRDNAIEKVAEKRLNLCNQSPEFAQLDAKLKQNTADLCRALISGSADAAEKCRTNSALINSEQTELLNKLGLPDDYLKPEFFCPICNDQGKTDNGDCICLTKIMNHLHYSRLCRELPVGDYSFESFSLDYYSGAERNQMSRVFNRCQNYANTFSQDSGSLLMFGNTGLGKTHLSLSIAKKLIENGHGVIYNSIQNFLNLIQRETFNHEAGNTQNELLNCELLIIDDMGVEFTTQFTSSVIYTVINTRLLNNRPTIISTNYDEKEIEQKYGQRIFSRLLGGYEWLQFKGKDIRIQKKLLK